MEIISAPLLLYSALCFGYALALAALFCRHGLAPLFTAEAKTLSPATRRKMRLLYISSPLLLIGIWGVAAASSLVDPVFLPGPDAVLRAAFDMIADGRLGEAALISFARIAVGFGFAAIIGLALGLLSGGFLLFDTLLSPINSFFRYIPPTAFIALLVVYFGVDEAYKYAVIFFGSIFFITAMTADVVRGLDYRYVEMGRMIGKSRAAIFFDILLPQCWPRLMDVMRLNLSGAWTFLVVAEITGAKGGIGHLISIAQRFLRTDELFVGILAFGVIGLLSDLLIDAFARKKFRWHYISLRQ